MQLETAFVMINCEMGSENSIIEQLRSINYVKEILGVFGNYDILVKIQCPSVEMISETITMKIRRIDKVRSTTTLMCAN